MPHAVSASVLDALADAIKDDHIGFIADAFVEMYVLAQLGVEQLPYARGVDDVACRLLRGETGQT